jgi:geranylgeranyl diphosphate synthase type I
MRALSAAVQDLVDGQSADTAFERRSDVALAECVRMAEHKTGALIARSCELGALFGAGTMAQVDGLRSFGDRLGLAFQFVDDLLGIWGDRSVTGKPVYSDLRNRKKSLPVVAALNSGTSAGASLALLYHRESPLSDEELVGAAELVELAGGRAWSQSRADSLFEEALGYLASVSSVVDELAGLARLAVRRDH